MRSEEACRQGGEGGDDCQGGICGRKMAENVNVYKRIVRRGIMYGLETVVQTKTREGTRGGRGENVKLLIEINQNGQDWYVRGTSEIEMV